MRNIDDYEQQYLKHPFERYQEKYRRKLIGKVIAKYAKKGCTIVEIGCGMMPLFVDYQDEFLFTIIEPANYCYENAKALSKTYRNVICYQGFFEDIAEQEDLGTYDLVICSGLLHEVEDPNQLLRAVKKLCHPGTVVHVNVPNAFSFHRLLAKEMGIIQNVHELSDVNKSLQQHNVFDMETLKQLVRSEGYRVTDEGSYLLKPFTHQQMQQCVDHQIINDEMLTALDRLCETCFKDYGSEIYLNLQLK